MKELIRDIANNKITKNYAINRVKEESALIDEVKELKRSDNRPTKINFNSDLIQLSGSDCFDNEQPDTTDMPNLESTKYAEQENQEGERLKILTQNQMLRRLPISLVQLKAGNNSEKLKNEIRQLLHSLYRSTKLIVLSILYKNGDNIYEP